MEHGELVSFEVWTDETVIMTIAGEDGTRYRVRVTQAELRAMASAEPHYDAMAPRQTPTPQDR